MDTSAEFMGSELADLSDVPLSALRSQSADVYARSLNRLLCQVERPRVNFSGGEGPPGRTA
ncbi:MULTISPECIES: hypothetical protein [unclassified Streptomyces]|uniref:hypothetical protein n=1 Tax=unclassified Streptomyces TaxID=2593676 RepID=UPI0008998DB4|nr:MULTISPECIES: hypothetical protein [unclassified Streptomyces]PKW07639.1 hypothetical protein BX260_2808 [Streptomyces sp. 5112.2]ROP53419.1 hypothetical protein EDD94_2927 [Streptomyces sp. PanSC9]SEC83657.1 hypothetical protein SAMN05428944_5289 [Streptomyces sp. 1222.5]SEC95131.1 hypothetical protein SAMN05216532_2904 [Streptomyces sp. 2231.1]